MFVFSRYIKKGTGISRNQERLLYYILIVAQAAFSLVLMGMINVKHFDVVCDINRLVLRYIKDES